MLSSIRAENLANGAEVQGVIVARKIDANLMAARDAHDTKVHLIEFEMKIGATAPYRVNANNCFRVSVSPDAASSISKS
jgi:hypothetical protein